MDAAYQRPLDSTNITVHQIFAILAGVACMSELNPLSDPSLGYLCIVKY
jgi:hypothetical protein